MGFLLLAGIVFLRCSSGVLTSVFVFLFESVRAVGWLSLKLIEGLAWFLQTVTPRYETVTVCKVEKPVTVREALTVSLPAPATRPVVDRTWVDQVSQERDEAELAIPRGRIIDSARVVI